MRTIRTAERRIPSPNNIVRRPMSGETRRRNFSIGTNSIDGLCLSVRALGPMSWSWTRDTPMSNTTRVNLISTAGDHSPSEAERSTWLGRRIAPVTRRSDRATHTSIRNRRAKFTNSRWAAAGSGAFLRRGTATRERKSMPPTQKVAAVR